LIVAAVILALSIPVFSGEENFFVCISYYNC